MQIVEGIFTKLGENQYQHKKKKVTKNKVILHSFSSFPSQNVIPLKTPLTLYLEIQNNTNKNDKIQLYEGPALF